MSTLAEDIADDVALESLGYKQELSRGMTLLCVRRCAAGSAERSCGRAPSLPAPAAACSGSIGITLGCMQPLLSGGVFQLGMLYGGACGGGRPPQRKKAPRCGGD